MKFLMALIMDDTVIRVVKKLRGRIKVLITDRDPQIVFIALNLLKKISSFEKSKGILDFDLAQALVLNLGHSSKKIFDETVNILAKFDVLDDDVYVKIMFSNQALSNILSAFPEVNDTKLLRFMISVIYQFSSDPKTSGNLMTEGGERLYVGLVSI